MLLVILLPALLLTGLLPAQETAEESMEQLYLERNAQGQTVSTRLIRRGDSFLIRAELSDGSLEEQQITLGENGETQSWVYHDNSRDSELEAVLNPDRTIRLTGRHRGKPVAKTFEINKQPWNQAFQQGLAPFLLGPQAKTVFWAIGTRGKGELKITRFTVKREDPRPVPKPLAEAGYPGPFLRVKLSLHGLLSIFWSGHYWYDAADGSFLFYQGKSSHLEGEVTLIRKNSNPR
jgi:hypothetical protein